MQLLPYEPYEPCDGRQEAVTVPLKPRDMLHTVRRRDGLHPSITRIVYGRNRIRLRWPALVTVGCVDQALILRINVRPADFPMESTLYHKSAR